VRGNYRHGEALPEDMFKEIVMYNYACVYVSMHACMYTSMYVIV